MANFIPSRPRQAGGPRRSFAIVASQYNTEYVEGLVTSARTELQVIAPGSTVTVWEVPGAFEIPLVVQCVAERGAEFEAIIALGVIIEGETQHAALIGRTVTDSLQQISLTTRVPIIHEVLLVKNEEQARARCLGLEMNRGIEAARIAVRMAQVMAAFQQQRR